MVSGEVLNDRNDYEPIGPLPPAPSDQLSRKRQRTWPIPLFTGAPPYPYEDIEDQPVPLPPPSAPPSPPPSPSPSEDPIHSRFEIPSAHLPPPVSSSWISSSSSLSYSSSHASTITSNNYSVQHINPYKRVRFNQRAKKALTIQDIYESSDEEDIDEIKAENALARRYLNKRFGAGEEEDDSSSDDDDDDDEKEEGRGSAKERRKRLEAKVQAYRAKYGHNMAKVRRKREEYWIARDIQRKWCALCTLKHKNKAGERFKDIDQMERYWFENLGRMTLEKTIKAVHIYHLVSCRPFYPKRSIDPYTGSPKPPHWWSTISIPEHFMEHDRHPYTYNVLQLQKSLDLLAHCESAMLRPNITIGKDELDHTCFLQRKALLLQIEGFNNYITKYKEQSSATHSLVTAMNAAGR